MQIMRLWITTQFGDDFGNNFPAYLLFVGVNNESASNSIEIQLKVLNYKQKMEKYFDILCCKKDLQDGETDLVF